jgi:hypothetical protein
LKKDLFMTLGNSMKKAIYLGLILLLLITIPAKGDEISGGNPNGHNTPGLVSQELKQGTRQSNFNSSTADPDLEPGFPTQIYLDAGIYQGGPGVSTLVGNIDDDPNLEILVTGIADGPLYAFKSDGSSVPNWPFYLYNRTFYSSLGNLQGQSDILEVFTSQSMFRWGEIPPPLMVAMAGSGSLISGWPKESTGDIRGPATLADLNNDHVDEILIEDYYSQLLYAYKADGTILTGFPIESDNPAYIAAADFDNDGYLEILVINNTANIYMYRHDGSMVPGFHIAFGYNGITYPVIGDVDGDKKPEIIILGFENRGYGNRMYVYIFSDTGTFKRELPPLNCGVSPALALADLDSDSIPEIIIGASNGIYVYRGDGTEFPGFPVNFTPGWVGNNAPVVGDVDGDGYQDIVFSVEQSDSSTVGDVYVYNSHGLLNPHFPKRLPMGGGAAPAIADIDADGRNEIIITGSFWDGWASNQDQVWVYDLKGQLYGKIEWGQLGGGPQHLGYYPSPKSYVGIDLSIKSPTLVATSPDKDFNIPVLVRNINSTVAADTMFTATLDAKLNYIGDTINITPTINGQNIIWDLGSINYSFQDYFTIRVRPAEKATYGDTFNIDLSVNSKETDVQIANNSTSPSLFIAHPVYLPIVQLHF